MDLVDHVGGDVWITQPDRQSGAFLPIDLVSQKRHLDWTLDVVSTGDWARVVELWMICPSTPLSPAGNTVRLPIVPSGTAFQFKVGTIDSSLSRSHRTWLAQIIGKVTDYETGACECFVFDYHIPGLIASWKTHIGLPGQPPMETWRPPIPGQPSIAPIGRLDLDVQGIHLPDYGPRREADCGCCGA
jgi:hypothetical protein